MESYWLFQASPNEDDLRDVFDGKRVGYTFFWRATLFKDPRTRMCPGDDVVMWQTRGREPAAAGVYALGRLTGKMKQFSGIWNAEVVLDHIRPLDSPIPPAVLRANIKLRALLVLKPKGHMGSNFRLDSVQWSGIQEVWDAKVIGGSEEALERRSRVELMSIERYLTGSTEVEPKRPYELTQQERSLVASYAEYIKKRGHLLQIARIPFSDDSHIRCDLYDQKRKLLIEAKGAPTRENIRMAIGELADYQRFLAVKSRAVLLPQRPSKDLEKLLQTQDIGLVWRNTDQSFTDNVRGKLS